MTAETTTTLILVDIAEAIAAWVAQGGTPALTASDVEEIARARDVTPVEVSTIARDAGVEFAG